MPPLTPPNPPRDNRLLRALVVAALSASVLWAAIGTIHWPIVGDAPLLHYATFLLDRGLAPYREIIEMDSPGTYALEWTVRHTLGPGPLAWRFADFLLTALCWLSMIAITLTASPQLRVPPISLFGDRGSIPPPPPHSIHQVPVTNPDWLPGFFAGALFALIHFRDGPTHTGQRDLMMTAMLLPACAALFQAFAQPTRNLSSRPERSAVERPVAPPVAAPLLTLFGLFLGLATTIKPSGIFFAAILTAMLWHHLRKLRIPATKSLAFTTLGFTIPIAITIAWLHHHAALQAFIDISRGLGAYHASLGRPPLASLLIGSFPSVLLAVAIPAIPLFLTHHPLQNWRNQIILAATLLGCLSYIVQGKGYPYHRYPTEAFLLLLIAQLAFPHLTPQKSVISTAVERPAAWPTYPALATILLGTLFLAPISAAIATHFDWRNQEFNHLLANDLTTLGGSHLHQQIQCFDNTAGCASTLYNLQLVSATGYLYDCYAFQSKPSAFQDLYRKDFLAAVAHAHPKVLVVTDQDCFTMNRSFSRLDRWPQFVAYLNENYTLYTQRTPPHTVGWWRHPAQPFSYRLYVRKPEAQP